MSKLIRESNKIKGLKTQTTHAERIAKLALFADDAAIYTAPLENLATLSNLLDKWCLASGAKFNEEKTIIIPLGPSEYRQRVIQTRSLTDDPSQKVHEKIRILKDGESVRYLGIQIGNKISENEPWPQILSSIEKSLSIWENAYPGLEGRRLIIQMIIGGKTQYITAAQGMPSEYETQLTKMIRTFLWGSDAAPPIAQKLLSDPIEQGGRKVLDIKARNDAIKIIKLKKILDHSENRPLAADAAIEIINRSLPRRIAEGLQDTDPNRDIFLMSTIYKKQHAYKTIPKQVREIINVGLKYNLTLDAPIISESHKRELPIRHHINELKQKKKQRLDKLTKCLTLTHKVKTIGDLTTQESLNDNHAHKKTNPICPCNECTTYRTNGCEEPTKCYKKATRILNSLPPKYNPNLSPNANLTPPQEDIEASHRHAIGDTNKVKIFNPAVTTSGKLHENFRILSKTRIVTTNQAQRDPPIDNPDDVIAFTDGSCQNNGETTARAGYGVWFGPNDPKNSAGPVGKNILHSNNTAELLAIHKALTQTRSADRLHIKTDSKWAIHTLCEDVINITDENFANTLHANIIRPILNKMRRRSGCTSFEWVKGHSNNEGNEQADALAAEGANTDSNNKTLFVVDPDFNFHGAKLAKITQAIAYKLIIQQKKEKITLRAKTNANLEMIRETLRSIA